MKNAMGLIWLVMLVGCTPPLVVDYKPFDSKLYSPQSKPAMLHEEKVDTLLRGEYVLIGLLDVQYNIRKCFVDNTCEVINSEPPSLENSQKSAAEKGGEIINVIDNKPITQHITKSGRCLYFTSSTYTYKGQTYVTVTCSSYEQIPGTLYAWLTRSLVWRRAPAQGNHYEYNHHAIKQAMELLAQTYQVKVEDPKYSKVSAESE